MIYELNHFGIVVSNLEKSLKFYQDVLGARVVFKGVIPASGTDVVYLQIAGGLVELLYRPEPRAGEEFGVTHIAFMTDDLDGDYAKLTAAGYEGLVAPKAAGTGIGRLAFLSDANGARVELLERDLKIRTEPVEHPIIKSFDHFSLMANDEAGAIDFYQAQLGMHELKSVTMPSGAHITYLHYDYDLLELLHKPEPSSDPVFAHIALRVDDVDEALAAFAKVGVSPEAGSPRAAGGGVGKIGVIRDPDGVKIEVLDRPDLRES